MEVLKESIMEAVDYLTSCRYDNDYCNCDRECGCDSYCRSDRCSCDRND